MASKKCKYCGAWFDSRSALKYHIKHGICKMTTHDGNNSIKNKEK